MSSLRSRLIYFLMKNRHWFQGKIKQEEFTFDSSIQEFRDLCEKGAAKYAKLPENLEVRKEVIAGINSEWLIPHGAPSNKVIIYVHGGGYVSGSCNDHRGFVSKFAVNCGFTNLTYEYRLAPEHKFSAAIDDSVLVYENIIRKGYTPKNILIAGESAGGGLCLALLLALKQRKIELPVAAVAISPWTDLTCSSDSYKTKNKVSLSPLNSWRVFSNYYAGENDLKNPLISPLFGELHGLPPIFINSGNYDELYEDGEKFYKKALEAGVEAYFREGDKMVHCYPLLSPMFPEAKEAMDEICEFIKQKLKS